MPQNFPFFAAPYQKPCRDHTKSDLLVLQVGGGGGVGVEILAGGVTAGAVMTLFGQSRRDTQRPIGPSSVTGM